MYSAFRFVCNRPISALCSVWNRPVFSIYILFLTGCVEPFHSVCDRPVFSSYILSVIRLYAAPHSLCHRSVLNLYILFAICLYSACAFYLLQAWIQVVILFPTGLYSDLRIFWQQACIKTLLFLPVTCIQLLHSVCDKPVFSFPFSLQQVRVQFHILFENLLYSASISCLQQACIHLFVLFATSLFSAYTPFCDRIVLSFYNMPATVLCLSLYFVYDRHIFSICMVLAIGLYSAIHCVWRSIYTAPRSFVEINVFNTWTFCNSPVLSSNFSLWQTCIQLLHSPCDRLIFTCFFLQQACIHPLSSVSRQASIQILHSLRDLYVFSLFIIFATNLYSASSFCLERPLFIFNKLFAAILFSAFTMCWRHKYFHLLNFVCDRPA